MMLESLLSLFLKPNCLLCDRSTQSLLCEHCQRQLQQHQWQPCTQFWTNSPPLFVWGEYEGTLKRAITTLKYNHLPQLGEELGIWLGESWVKSGIVSKNKQYTVIPIPLHPKRLQKRGFNQAEMIAKGFCRVTRYPLLANGLRRIRDTEKLFGLSSQEREKMMSKALVLGKDCQNKRISSPILIIDDIYTTGTTIKEAIRVLKQHRLSVLGVAAMAKPRFH